MAGCHQAGAIRSIEKQTGLPVDRKVIGQHRIPVTGDGLSFGIHEHGITCTALKGHIEDDLIRIGVSGAGSAF